jgi:hypothetical protein
MVSRFAAFEEGDRWEAVEAAHPWLATEVTGTFLFLEQFREVL